MATSAHASMSVEFLAAMIDHVAHPIFVKDRAFRFVLVNKALCDMVGVARADMLGKTDYDFFPATEADFFRHKDNELLQSGRTVEIDEEPITDAEGNQHILATTKVPFRNDQGDITHIVGIIHDITRMKHTEEALRHANERLEEHVLERSNALAAAQNELLRKERLAMLGHLAGGLAHELRNPLGAIQNAVALLRKSDLAPLPRQALAVIDEEVRRADSIIRDLLDYARVRPASPRDVPVQQLVEAALELEHVPEHVQVEITGDDEVIAAVDALQVQTALGNLVRNAFEAMPGGGTLAVDFSRVGDRVRIVVTDTGEGVREEVRDRLFEPLVTTKALGIGLGLSTAKSLIENQSGSLRYEDGRRGGAAFVIDLPAATR
jgi:PAS domain S-box-containing protein